MRQQHGRRMRRPFSWENDMERSASASRGLLLACVLMACNMAQAQSDATVDKTVARKQAGEIASGDPARWHNEDMSRQARLRTLQKEIGAAYEEQKKACRAGPAVERDGCLRQARQTWQEDMKNAPAQLDAAPAGSVTTTRETVAGAQR
jgi:hypothetical protein